MSKSKKQKKLPKDVEQLTSDEVMQTIFGKTAQKQLKREATQDTESDDSPTLGT